MAKHKRKISASQRNKEVIALAKTLKRKGLLSPKTKLHGGRFVSRGVLKKVQELQIAARPSYTNVKVSPKFAKIAREEGYKVSNNRVIVPKDHDFIKRMKQAAKEGKAVSGVKPVKGGYMSEIKFSHEPGNYDELLRMITDENLDSMKLSDERFAFQVGGDQQGGPVGMSWRSFSDGNEIANYLRHYKPDIFVKGIKFFRLHPEDEPQFIVSQKRRDDWRKKQTGMIRDKRGNLVRKKSTRLDDLARINPRKAEKIRAHNRKQARKQYEKKKNDPIYMMNARERARESYERRKKEKIWAKKGRKK